MSGFLLNGLIQDMFIKGDYLDHKNGKGNGTINSILSQSTWNGPRLYAETHRLWRATYIQDSIPAMNVQLRAHVLYTREETPSHAFRIRNNSQWISPHTHQCRPCPERQKQVKLICTTLNASNMYINSALLTTHRVNVRPRSEYVELADVEPVADVMSTVTTVLSVTVTVVRPDACIVALIPTEEVEFDPP